MQAWHGPMDRTGFTLELEELSWENGKLGVEVDPGVYRIITGNRLPNGNVFGKSLTFRVEKGEEKTVEMSFRDAKLKDMLENISILPFNLLDKDGSKVPAADVTRGDRKILFWLEVSKEPTEHILNELMERKEAFENYKENLLFIIKTRISRIRLLAAAAKHCREFLCSMTPLQRMSIRWVAGCMWIRRSFR